MRSCEKTAAATYLLDSARMFQKDGMSLEEFLALAEKAFVDSGTVAMGLLKRLKEKP